jgi:hypothetical protein
MAIGGLPALRSSCRLVQQDYSDILVRNPGGENQGESGSGRVFGALGGFARHRGCAVTG